MSCTKRAFVFFIAVAIIICLIPTAAFATDGDRELDVEIEKVYGGAKGIVSLTFDDGVYQTALVVEELCEKYDLKASMMIIANKMEGTISGRPAYEVWNELFQKGYLEPQNHSMSHMGFRNSYVTSDGEPKSDIANMTPENYKTEILDSCDLLSECFPDFDIICYAMPHGSWCDDARAVGVGKYHMIRGTRSNKQTLDPSTELGVVGSWSFLNSPSTVAAAGVDQLAKLKNWIDTAAEGYWYCPITHKVGDVEKTEISYATADAWFAYIKEVRDRGDIWVTTASEATKYIRERQNSTASARLSGGKVTVKVDMAEMTADDLPLDKSVFDYPLTLKVELPEGYSRVAYTAAGECRVADAFTEGGVNYALVDVVPDGREAVLTPVDESYRAHKLTDVPMVESTCLEEGTVEHKMCTVCGCCYNEDGRRLRSVKLPLGSHTLTSVAFKPASCTEDGTVLHKHCEVCLKNFDSNLNELEKVTVSKKGHTTRPVAAVEPTEQTEGLIAHEQCIFCGLPFDDAGNPLSSVTVPKLQPGKDSKGVVIAVAAGGGAVALGGGFSVYWFVFRKRKI